jgi:hypothetical protein
MGGLTLQYAIIPETKRKNSPLRIQRTKSSQPIKSPADRILFLQRTIGNQAVQRLIKSGTLQAKLKIGQPGDKYEQEADRVADAVMRMPEPGVQRQVEPEEEEEETLQTKPSADQITPLVQKQEDIPEEEQETAQAKGDGGPSTASSSVESGINSIRGGGQPLPVSTRAFFEPRFRTNFSSVEVHTGANANHLARSINAKAFTVGKDVVFGADQYSPESLSGKQLLAHELTHVVQQGKVNPIDSKLQSKSKRKHYATKPKGIVAKESSKKVSKMVINTHTGEKIMRVRDPYLDACERQFNRCIRHSRSSLSCLAARGSCLIRARPRVYIISASIPRDQIVFSLGPAGRTGRLTLELLLGGTTRYTFGSWLLRSNRYRTNFHITRLPVGDFDQLRAIWNVYGSNFSTFYPYHFKVLGQYRHSQYNIPHESSCRGPNQRAYITTSACNFTRTRLRRGFISQVNLNGSGISIRHGSLQREQFCIGRRGSPADAANRSFRQVAAIRGSCGSNTGALNNSSVARLPSHPDLNCNDQVYIHTVGVKTVTDLCPGCSQNQLDNFTTQAACAGITDRGRFLTIKL